MAVIARRRSHAIGKLVSGASTKSHAHCGSSMASPWYRGRHREDCFGREPEKLPVVMSAEEVVRFLEAAETWQDACR